MTVELKQESLKSVRDRFYGCGAPVPPALEGCTVLSHLVGIADDSVNLVVFNCVMSHSPDESGEMCFSDVFTDRRIPDELAADPVLRGECLGGAMYVEDLRRLMEETGCASAGIRPT